MPDLMATKGASFDLVILCNVLHEIPAADWLARFKEIDGVLADGGVLLVMEHLTPSVGELPHDGGYLLLDHSALKELFAAPDAVKTVAEARAGTLVAIAVPKTALAGATASSRIAALEHVKKTALERIRQIRRGGNRDGSARIGRDHAHQVVQFANASLALSQLEGIRSGL